MQEQRTYTNFHPDLRVPSIDLDVGGFTLFIFGGQGTRKTTGAGLFPNPLFLSCGPEGGDDALTQFPALYGRPIPPIFRVTSVQHMTNYVNWIVTSAKQAGFCTIVVDSITFYIDMWISEELKKRQLPNGELPQMRKPDWGALETHLVRNLAMKLHGTGLNIIWLALEKRITESNEKDGTSRLVGVEPLFTGGARLKIPALCKMFVHAENFLEPNPNAMGRSITIPNWWVSPTNLNKDIRHKYGNSFPEGKLVAPPPAFYGVQTLPQGFFDPFGAIYSRIGNLVYTGPQTAAQVR